MINTIKMDLYRMFKSKFVYVLLIVAAVSLLITAKSQQYTMELIKSNSESYQQLLEEESELDYDNIEYALGIKEFSFPDFLNMNFSNDMLVFISIFAAIFVNAQQKNGYIKSISQLSPKRGRFAISNGVSVAAFTLIFYIEVFLVSMLGFAWFFNDISFSGFSDFIGIFLIKLLLFIAFGILVLMFATVMKSTGLSMTVGILCSAGLISSIFSLIDLLLYRFFDISRSFSVSNYTITQNIYKLSIESSNSELLRAGIVGVLFIAVSMIISVFVMNKRDVK